MYGGTEVFQTDPHWRDLILFYEYFHGDNGAGLGASHQTGWTGVVARLIQLFGEVDAATVLDRGRPPGGAPLPPTVVDGQVGRAREPGWRVPSLKWRPS